MKKSLINTEDNSRLLGTVKGSNVFEFTLTDGIISATVLNLGGILTNLKVPDNKGELVDVVLGYNDLDGYVNDFEYLGAIIGRVANATQNARFEMNGKVYNLSTNQKHSSHGGVQGFNKKIWKVEDFTKNTLTLSLFSEDGDQGYPANLKVTAKYIVGGGSLKLEITATPDGETPVSLTFHPYFNLNGEGASLDGHNLKISSNYITKVDSELIANGETLDVNGTAYDFNEIKPLLKDIESVGGYDINYILQGSATLESNITGIKLEITSNQKGLQLYTSEDLADIEGKSGVYSKRSAVCLEPQNYPNSVNVKSFPSPFIKNGETYKWVAEYKFSTVKNPQ